jgi:hypothetical protein
MTTTDNKRKWDTAGIILMVTILALVWTICLLTPPAAALTSTTITAENVEQYSFEASPDHYIYQIIIDSLPIGTNQTHVLNAAGAVFLLDIRSTQSWWIYNDFTVSMTYPNSTVETINATTTRLSDGTYKTTIQPVFSQLQSMTPAWKIDLIVGTNPTTVSFNSIVATPPMSGTVITGQNTTNPIPFTAVSGQFSGQSTTVYAYECPMTEFAEQISIWNPFGSASTLLSGLLDWSWSTIVTFINMIPVIGPQLLVVMVFIYTVGAEIIFWISYIFTNFWLVLAGIELLIIMFGFLLAGKKPKPEKVVRNIVNYNISIGRGFLWVLTMLWGWLLRFSEFVGRLIRG